MNIGHDRQETMAIIIAALVIRDGGEIVLTDAEMAKAKGSSLVADPDDRRQVLTVTLIPDYVVVGQNEET